MLRCPSRALWAAAPAPWQAVWSVAVPAGGCGRRVDWGLHPPHTWELHTWKLKLQNLGHAD